MKLKRFFSIIYLILIIFLFVIFTNNCSNYRQPHQINPNYSHSESIQQPPITQKQNPILPIETICTHQESDLSVQGPLLIQDDQYFFKDMLYESNQMHYKSIDVKSKKLLWDVTYPDLRSPYTALRVANQDSVFFPTSVTPIEFTKSEIVALNRSDGSVRWKYGPLETIVIVDCMTIVKDYLFVATFSWLYALDIHSGKLLWNKHITELLPLSNGENKHYSIDSIFSNQSSVLIQYSQEIIDENSQLRDSYDGVLAIQPDNGSTLWKYEIKQEEQTFFDDSFEAIGNYVLAFGSILLDSKNGKLIWQYKPDSSLKYHIKYIGHDISEEVLVYTYHQSNSSVIVGLDVQTGLEKWKQDTHYFSNEIHIEQNYLADQIFSFYSTKKNNDDASKVLPIDQMDVFDCKNGKLLQTYIIPKSIWFKYLASEISYIKGYWYFVGQSTPDDIGQVSLFRFKLKE